MTIGRVEDQNAATTSGDLLGETRPSLVRRILEVPLEIGVGIFIVVDGIIRPLFRPVVRILSSLRLIRRIETAIASLPPYVILVLLGVPFAIAELTKVYAVVLMAEDHFRLGMTMFIGAYVVSILVCERIFHAGKGQLLTIPWFKWLFDWVMVIKDHIFGWVARTRIWKMAHSTRLRAKLAWRRLRVRMRYAFGMRERGPQKGVLEHQ